MASENLHIDSGLILQVAKGNEKAFKCLFKSYYARLFQYVFSIIKSKEVAEELAMDVFLKIWLGREVIPKIERFDAFLFKVARNKCIDFLRSAARDQKLKELLFEQIEASQKTGFMQPELVEEYELLLREAVSLLSPQRKKVYQLSREAEMTHDEIAAQLNLSKNTVNNHLVEAKRFIRTYFTKNCDTAFIFLLLMLE